MIIRPHAKKTFPSMSRRRRRLFGIITTPELITILAVLAGLTAIAYNYVGPIQQRAVQYKAAIKIASDFQTLYDAGQSYYAIAGQGLTSSVAGVWQTQLLSNNVLTSVPVLRSDQGWDQVTTPYAYTLNGTTYTGWGNAVQADTVLVLAGVNEITCQMINSQYSNMSWASIILSSQLQAVPVAPEFTIDQQCYSNAGVYTVVRPMFPDEVH
jgi:hypothetical protein